MDMLNDVLTVKISSSFVKTRLKIITESGNGEAKLFIGSLSQKDEFNNFFNDFDNSNSYCFDKNNLLDYLKYMRIEYIAQKCNQYQNVTKEYYEEQVKKVNNLTEQDFKFKITSYLDDKRNRYYIRGDGNTKNIFDWPLREIALPKITKLEIRKSQNQYIFNLILDEEEIIKRTVSNNITTLDNTSLSTSDSTKTDLSEEYDKFLIGKLADRTRENYVNVLRGNLSDTIDADIENIDIYSISNKNEFLKIVKSLENASNYKEVNEKTNRTLSSSLNWYSKFLDWRSKNQKIFFGAPGTGKSYSLKQEAYVLVNDDEEHIERVTFHPDYTYANFVGSYKPIMKTSSDDSEDRIAYEYVPGPFMRTLVKALKNPNKPYVLIVEEINRSNVAAVFGDVFQLLDRTSEGISEYSITTSDDMRAYLAKEEIDGTYLTLPSNMFIWATMNSADQGVYPMDTAFKRRWSFKYIGIDDEEEKLADNATTPKFTLGEDKTLVSWNTLRKAINEELSSDSYNINEDKLMGPFFLASSALENQETFVEAFKNKVLMYLFDDVVKQKRRQFFNGYNRYSEICKAFDTEGLNIFPENVINFVKEHTTKGETKESGDEV